jgi:hypothetical protein
VAQETSLLRHQHHVAQHVAQAISKTLTKPKAEFSSNLCRET